MPVETENEFEDDEDQMADNTTRLSGIEEQMG